MQEQIQTVRALIRYVVEMNDDYFDRLAGADPGSAVGGSSLFLSTKREGSCEAYYSRPIFRPRFPRDTKPAAQNAFFRPIALRSVPRDGREMSRHSRRGGGRLYLNPTVLCIRLHHASSPLPLPIKIANLPDVWSRNADDNGRSARGSTAAAS